MNKTRTFTLLLAFVATSEAIKIQNIGDDAKDSWMSVRNYFEKDLPGDVSKVFPGEAKALREVGEAWNDSVKPWLNKLPDNINKMDEDFSKYCNDKIKFMCQRVTIEDGKDWSVGAGNAIDHSFRNEMPRDVKNLVNDIL